MSRAFNSTCAVQGEAVGLQWIELHTNLPRHPKSLALGLALSNPMAWAHMAALWLWCAENRPDGTFRGEVAGAMVEAAANWMGKPGAFVVAAVAAGFLETTEGGFVARSWVERAAAHIAKLERDSARQRERYATISKRFSGKKQEFSVDSPPENARRNGGEPRDLSGNSNSNSNSKSNTDSNLHLPTEEIARPPKAPVFASVPEKPTTPEDSWSATEFWAWVQSRRVAGGYVAEQRPRPEVLDRWWSACLMHPGVTVRGMKLGFTHGFGKDKFWEPKGFPFAAFLKGWTKYVRTEEPNAVAG